MKPIKSIVRRVLPAPLRTFIQRLYYPRMIRRMTPEIWPPARIVRELLRDGDVVADVGANIGYVTYWLSQWVGESGEVHSFEPVPQTFAFLANNVIKLGLRNVRLYRAAVSDREGQVALDVPNWAGESAANLYEARVVDNPNNGAHTVTAPALTLDQVFEDSEKPLVFVKLDVEGHELRALQGAQRIIGKWKPALAIEVSEQTAARVFGELQTLGYTAYEPEKDSLRRQSGPCALTDGLFIQQKHISTLQARGVRISH